MTFEKWFQQNGVPHGEGYGEEGLEFVWDLSAARYAPLVEACKYLWDSQGQPNYGPWRQVAEALKAVTDDD